MLTFFRRPLAALMMTAALACCLVPRSEAWAHYAIPGISSVAAGDPQVVTSLATNESTQSESNDLQNAANTFQSVQTTGVLSTVSRYDQLYYHAIYQTTDPSAVYNAHVSPPPTSADTYSFWQKAGYYNTFTPSQQRTLQSLQPILSAADDTAHYRYDPASGTIQIQASGLIGEIRLLVTLENLGIARTAYVHYFENPNDYLGPSGSYNSGAVGGVFGMIFGVDIKVPPNPPQEQTPGQLSPPPTVGTPPNHSPSTALNQ